MIELKNISKKFVKTDKNKKQVEFLADNDITLTAKEGEIIGILGPNGAGKTTLLRVIAGIMQPSSGSILIDNMSYKNSSEKIKSSISFLSGNTKLYKDLSCIELLNLCGEYYDIDKTTLNKRIDDIVKRFDLENFKNQRIGNLSTGQMQRVNLARCLVHDPKYYILDEATSGLDIISSKTILDFIKEEKSKGKCILYSTHYMEEAENICDRVILIHKGSIVSSGTPKEIEKNTKTDNLRDAFFAVIGGAK